MAPAVPAVSPKASRNWGRVEAVAVAGQPVGDSDDGQPRDDERSSADRLLRAT
jgi:hypothetical protein